MRVDLSIGEDVVVNVSGLQLFTYFDKEHAGGLLRRALRDDSPTDRGRLVFAAIDIGLNDNSKLKARFIRALKELNRYSLMSQYPSAIETYLMWETTGNSTVMYWDTAEWVNIEAFRNSVTRRLFQRFTWSYATVAAAMVGITVHVY
jgi:hypothetical protein